MSAAAVPASTVVLMREAPDGLEVFVVRRHDNIAFMGGAHVFPGGRVDDGDREADLERHCDGVEPAVAALSDVPRSEAVAYHAAAIRELFEEAGVLLARRPQQSVLAIEASAAGRFAEYRRDLLEQRQTVGALAAREGVLLALDALAFAGHWVTPEIETRRFDTRFFLARAPDGQAAAHDRGESTDSLWIRPADAIARCLDGAIALPPPTWTTLRMLSRFRTPDAAWHWARARTVPRVQPGFVARADGTRLVTLPGDPLCSAVPGFEVEETRFLLKDGRWLPVRE